MSKTDQTRVQYLCQKQNSYPRVQRNFTTPTNQLNAILNNDKEIEHVWFNSSVGLKAMKEPPLKEVEIWDDEFNVELKIPDLVLHNQGKLVEDANNLKLFSLHIQGFLSLQFCS